MRIGELAAGAGVNVQTLRYYERRGLLRPTKRLASGYREYPSEALNRVRFIKRAQALGFTLREIETSLRQRGGAGCAEIRAAALEKIHEIDLKIEELTAMRATLERVAAACGAADCVPKKDDSPKKKT